MKIEAVKLKNFKAFQDAEMRNIPRMCVVVGSNGSGKSTLFSVFSFLKDTAFDTGAIMISKAMEAADTTVKSHHSRLVRRFDVSAMSFLFLPFTYRFCNIDNKRFAK